MVSPGPGEFIRVDKNSTSVATFLKKAHAFLDMSTVLPNKNFYAFCFCKHPDLLSQWRGYSAGGGYAIGFDIDPAWQDPNKKMF